jgi:hypothetical protein
MITKIIETDPNEFKVSSQAIEADRVTDTPIQIIEGAGDLALLGASTLDSNPNAYSLVETVETPEGETVVNLVNAVSKELRYFRDHKTDEPRMDRQPQARTVYVTGEYKPGATLTLSEEPLTVEEIEEVFPRVLTAA